MKTRWRVQNVNYDWARGNPARLRRTVYEDDQPWEASIARPEPQYKTFATHAEAITYADKQARRTA